MIRSAKLLLQKYCLYGGLLLLLYVLQNTPGFLSFWGVKPLLVLPLVVSIAMAEGELVGGLFGLAAGLLCDSGSLVLFGSNALLYMGSCVLIGLLVIYYMQPSLPNALLFTGFSLGLRLLFQLFHDLLWGYGDLGLTFLRHSLPMLGLTLLATPPLFFFVRRIVRFYQKKLDL